MLRLLLCITTLFIASHALGKTSYDCQELIDRRDFARATEVCWKNFANAPSVESQLLGDVYHAALAACELGNPKQSVMYLRQMVNLAEQRMRWVDFYTQIEQEDCFRYRGGTEIRKFLVNNRPRALTNESSRGFYEDNSLLRIEQPMPWEHSGLTWTDQGFGGEFSFRWQRRFGECFKGLLKTCGYSNAFAIGRDVWGETLFAEYQHRIHMGLDWGVGVGPYQTSTDSIGLQTTLSIGKSFFFNEVVQIGPHIYRRFQYDPESDHWDAHYGVMARGPWAVGPFALVFLMVLGAGIY